MVCTCQKLVVWVTSQLLKDSSKNENLHDFDQRTCDCIHDISSTAYHFIKNRYVETLHVKASLILSN